MLMKKAIGALALIAIGAGSACATEGEVDPSAGAAAPEGRAYIPFANFRGSIDNWEADGREGLWVQGHNDQWYYAKFMGPCIGLPYETTIGFVTDGLNRIDEFSSILVDGQRCWFQSFEKSDGPPEDDD